MAPAIGSWLSGTPESGGRPQYPGEALGLPEHGPGSLASLGRRFVALLLDWLIAYGLAEWGMALKLVTEPLLPTVVLIVWFLLGAAALRLFGFTPGQFACGLQVASIDQVGVGIGRAVVRGIMIALVVPPLFVDVDGRGVQDRLTRTAVVRR